MAPSVFAVRSLSSSRERSSAFRQQLSRAERGLHEPSKLPSFDGYLGEGHEPAGRCRWAAMRLAL